jgi:transposase
MIGVPMYRTILTLYKQGNSQRKIAKLTCHDRKTVKRIVSKYYSSGVESPNPYQKESKTSKWH